MEPDRILVLLMWFASMVPYTIMALRENGSSRGWISRMFAGQDGLLLGTIILSGPLTSLLGEGTIRHVFTIALVLKLITGLAVLKRQHDIVLSDKRYYSEIGVSDGNNS